MCSSVPLVMGVFCCASGPAGCVIHSAVFFPVFFLSICICNFVVGSVVLCLWASCVLRKWYMWLKLFLCIFLYWFSPTSRCNTGVGSVCCASGPGVSVFYVLFNFVLLILLSSLSSSSCSFSQLFSYLGCICCSYGVFMR